MLLFKNDHHIEKQYHNYMTRCYIMTARHDQAYLTLIDEALKAY